MAGNSSKYSQESHLGAFKKIVHPQQWELIFPLRAGAKIELHQYQSFDTNTNIFKTLIFFPISAVSTVPLALRKYQIGK